MPQSYRVSRQKTSLPRKHHRNTGMRYMHMRVPPSDAGRKVVMINCHSCGYCPDRIPPDGCCPKCGSYSWERFALSAKLHPELVNQ